ncbi:hypothetical protein TIFTF001_043057 [Ficus carica]|uniref:Uncharacterized protein n=1 Tax=Ficus carica TaxID=3494 RepID=A0AA87YYI6_FICCA|nr:hypothetical protein TIFTF001_043057 [Ficus carica]
MGWGPAGGVVANDGGKVNGDGEDKGEKFFIRWEARRHRKGGSVVMKTFFFQWRGDGIRKGKRDGEIHSILGQNVGKRERIGGERERIRGDSERIGEEVCLGSIIPICNCNDMTSVTMSSS